MSIFIDMKLVRLYESVLREGEAQSCVAKYGNILFGDQLGGDERNTGVEDNHAGAVRKFTDYNFGTNIKPKIQQAIIELKKCMEAYPEVLKPRTEMVYRGTNAPIMEFIKNGRIPSSHETQPYIYKANSVVQSWTEYESVAEKFGDAERFNGVAKYIDLDNFNVNRVITELHKVKIPVIMQYKATPDDFLFKGEYLNKLSEFDTEHEVIRVDNQPIEVEAYLNDKFLGMSARRLIEKLNDSL